MNQHTVPRFLLRGFTSDKKHRIWVYDKHTGTKFRTNIKNAAAERGFYDLSSETAQVSLESGLEHIETRTAPLLQELTTRKSLASIKDDSRLVLALFVAVLFVRTREHRLRAEHLGQLFRERLREMGASEEQLEAFTVTPDESKVAGLRAVLLQVPQFVPHLLSKVWALFEAPPRRPTYISDNPVTLHNELDHEPYGNIGLAVRGIQIYVPLSSRLTLALWCPSVAEPFLQAAKNIRLADQVSPGFADRTLRNPQFARPFCEGLETGRAIRVVEEHVTMMNSLQVMYSSRFVYCEMDDFSLVEQMLRDKPKYREGLKPTLA